MKKVSIILLAFILLFNTCVFADDSEAVNPVELPSIDAAVCERPVSEEILIDGSTKQTYENISEEQFNTFLLYAEQEGCSLPDYTVKGSLFKGSFLKNGKTFSVSYDLSTGFVTAVYPKGTIAGKRVCHQVGDTVIFGRYEQDNDLSNGKEEIEWIVLDIQDDYMLLMSQYGLDCKFYNESADKSTWENCTLRKWLNAEFVNESFTETEQEMIRNSEIKNEDNKNYHTSGGSSTTDKVFLLSIDEAEMYSVSNEERRCVPTSYSIAQGIKMYNTSRVKGKDTGWWWLRSPGHFSGSAAYVNSSGAIDNNGVTIIRNKLMVRPAMWVDLNI